MLVRLLPLRSRPPLPVYRNQSPSSRSSSYLRKHGSPRLDTLHRNIGRAKANCKPQSPLVPPGSHVGCAAGRPAPGQRDWAEVARRQARARTLPTAPQTVRPCPAGRRCQPRAAGGRPTAGSSGGLATARRPTLPAARCTGALAVASSVSFFHGGSVGGGVPCRHFTTAPPMPAFLSPTQGPTQQPVRATGRAQFMCRLILDTGRSLRGPSHCKLCVVSSLRRRLPPLALIAVGWSAHLVPGGVMLRQNRPKVVAWAVHEQAPARSIGEAGALGAFSGEGHLQGQPQKNVSPDRQRGKWGRCVGTPGRTSPAPLVGWRGSRGRRGAAHMLRYRAP